MPLKVCLSVIVRAKLLLNNKNAFEDDYDKKLYIVGCCRILTKFQTIEFSRNHFIALFTHVLDMLVSIKNAHNESLTLNAEQLARSRQKSHQPSNNYEDSDEGEAEGDNNLSTASLDSDGD